MEKINHNSLCETETHKVGMTDNEVIKALERCGQHRECCYCNSVEECGNKRILTASTLDLINRQKAEIERLNRALVTQEKQHELKMRLSKRK